MRDLMRCRSRECWVVAGIAAVFLALHLPYLASALADIDSVNLALGLRDFDPAQHRPHPPGYPIFIALGKLASLVLTEPRALAIWGVLFAAAAAFALWICFSALERADDPGGAGARHASSSSGTAVAAAAVALSAPLVWMSASRPMTDLAGLGAAAIAQALLAAGLARQNLRTGEASTGADAVQAVESGRLILMGAFAAALAIGVRSQAVWLTLPLLAYVLTDRVGRGAAGALIGSTVWFLVGTLLWAVPLVIASGGVTAYWAAFRNQAGEDWTEADILATHPGVHKAAAALVDTFIRPWDSYWLGGVIVLLAAAGVIVLAVRGRRALYALLSVAVPYGAFHLLFQETAHTRYAIPLVPIVAYLAMRGLAAAGRRALVAGAAVIVLVSVVSTQPKLVAYSRGGSPSASLLAAMRARIESGLTEPRPVLRLPQALALAWRDERLGLDAVPTLRARQWTALVEHWRGGSTRPVWYVAEPEASGLDNRHDLVQFDPSARRLVGSWRWPFQPANLLGGVRPSDLDWYELDPPGWMMLDSGSLTPRLAGLAAGDTGGLTRGGLRMLVRRRAGPVNVMVGGRNLGKAGAPAVIFTLSVDGEVRDSWTVAPSPGFFVRTWAWPDGVAAGEGAYALMSIRASVDGRDEPALAAIEQFDVQPAGRPILAFGEGWHEQEYDPSTGRLWRWAGERATIRVIGAAGDALLRVTGEAPSRYFDHPARVVVLGAGRVLFESTVSDDYDWTIPLPADVLRASDGRLTIATDQSFRPADRQDSPDARVLGLRTFIVSLTPASWPGTAASFRTAG